MLEDKLQVRALLLSGISKFERYVYVFCVVNKRFVCVSNKCDVR